MAPQIVVEALRKHYRVHRRPPGFRAALRSLFVRRYDVVKAVDGVDFALEAGERVGFLGPNGAGKTTTLKMLSGLLYPTSGRVEVAGYVPQERRLPFLETIMLVMGQKQQLIWDLPPADTFDLNRAIYQVPRGRFEETVAELTELLDLGDLVLKPTRELSLGERMKCELVAALIHRPRVLFLDEPTIGLDVTTQARVRQFIRDYNARHGATVLLTSHDMDDVAALCPRVIVIDQGTIAHDGPLDDLVKTLRPEKRLTLQLATPADAPDLRALGGTLVEVDGHRVVLQVPAEALARTVERALATLPVQDLTAEAPPLEEILAEMFARSRAAREATAGSGQA
jgi:ABC-2 type transport system ATP-binding protein